MKTKPVLLVILILAIAGVALFFLLSPSDVSKNSDSDKLKVAATIFPLKSIAESIGGDRVEVELILPPGVSPHTFEATPEDITKLGQLDALFMIGHGIDEWSLDLVSAQADVDEVVVDNGIEMLKITPEDDHEGEDEHSDEEDAHEEEEHGHDHDSGVNPHYWLSLQNAKLIAQNIYDKLVALDPDNKSYYQENLNTFKSDISAAETEMKDELASLSIRELVTFHEAWGYFAKEFDLEVVASVEPVPGKNPTAKYLIELEEIIKENNIKVIFTEPQLSTDPIKPFLDDFGVEISVLDPLGGTHENDTYLSVMRNNVAVLKNSLLK